MCIFTQQNMWSQRHEFLKSSLTGGLASTFRIFHHTFYTSTVSYSKTCGRGDSCLCAHSETYGLVHIDLRFFIATLLQLILSHSRTRIFTRSWRVVFAHPQNKRFQRHAYCAVVLVQGFSLEFQRLSLRTHKTNGFSDMHVSLSFSYKVFHSKFKGCLCAPTKQQVSKTCFCLWHSRTRIYSKFKACRCASIKQMVNSWAFCLIMAIPAHSWPFCLIPGHSGWLLAILAWFLAILVDSWPF